MQPTRHVRDKPSELELQFTGDTPIWCVCITPACTVRQSHHMGARFAEPMQSHCEENCRERLELCTSLWTTCVVTGFLRKRLHPQYLYERLCRSNLKCSPIRGKYSLDKTKCVWQQSISDCLELYFDKEFPNNRNPNATFEFTRTRVRESSSQIHKHEELCAAEAWWKCTLELEASYQRISYGSHFISRTEEQSIPNAQSKQKKKNESKGRQIDRQKREKKREREKYQGKKHKPHGYSALVSHIKLRGEAFTWRRRSQRQTFPGRQSSRLGSRDLCCNRDHTGGHGYTHGRHRRHLAATLLSCFLSCSQALQRERERERRRVEQRSGCRSSACAVQQRAERGPGMGGGRGRRRGSEARETTGSNSSGRERGATRELVEELCFILLAKLFQKAKLNLKISKIEWFWRFSIAKSEGKKE